MSEIEITGYTQHGHCEHCGRVLKHCIRISDGRIVGATCFDKQLTAPREYQGKKYRIGAEEIVRRAKIAQYVPAMSWDRYGVTASDFGFIAS
jgi:hypothetical protein